MSLQPLADCVCGCGCVCVWWVCKSTERKSKEKKVTLQPDTCELWNLKQLYFVCVCVLQHLATQAAVVSHTSDTRCLWQSNLWEDSRRLHLISIKLWKQKTDASASRMRRTQQQSSVEQLEGERRCVCVCVVALNAGVQNAVFCWRSSLTSSYYTYISFFSISWRWIWSFFCSQSGSETHRRKKKKC